MESIAEPLRRLQEQGAWFARAREVRLLWVATEAALRATAVSCCLRLEYHADNHSLFIPLDAPWSGADSDARARCAAFAGRFVEKAEALRAAGIEVGPFVAEPAPEHASLADLGRQLQLGCRALRAPLRGLAIVLAPARVESASEFLADVRALASAPLLADVRWLVIESDTRQLEPLVRELGPARALAVDFRIDDAQQQRDLAALAGPAPTEGSSVLPPHPWGPWSSGGAMPSVAPPPRRADRRPPSDELLRAHGLSPAYVKGGGQELRRSLLHAALALRQGRLGDALELQARTAALCERLELPREQVIQLLVLGGYQLAASLPEQARATYRRAGDLAALGDLPLQAAQAELGLGMIAALAHKPEALRHYAEAAQLAERAELLPLAIECWRMAGQFASEQRARDTAIECWRRGWALTGQLDASALRSTSAATLANLLAGALLAHGPSQEAQELQWRAHGIEHGLEPGAVGESIG